MTPKTVILRRVIEDRPVEAMASTLEKFMGGLARVFGPLKGDKTFGVRRRTSMTHNLKKTVTAGVILRRGIDTLPAAVLKFLVENEAECQKVLDGLDAHRDDAIAAAKALDVRLGEFDSLEEAQADLADREADFAARAEALAAREAKVDNCVRAITELWEIPDDLEPAEFDRAIEVHAHKFGLPWPARDNPKPMEMN